MPQDIEADIADATAATAAAAPLRPLHVHVGSLEVNRLERRTLDGRLYAVAPAVAIREGVLNGNLVLADEIANSVLGWNGRPVPIGHPEVNGVQVSANSPDILEAWVVGNIFNARMVGDKLLVEVWLDVEKANRLGGEALAVLGALDDGAPMDVSTGYFADVEVAEGFYNGQAYRGVQYNILPDHLALLPDEQGACGWQDGCGVPRTNAAKTHKENIMTEDEVKAASDGQPFAEGVAQPDDPACGCGEQVTANAEDVQPEAADAAPVEDAQPEDADPAAEPFAPAVNATPDLEAQWAELGELISEAGGMDKFRSTLMQAFDVAMLVSDLGGIDAVRGLLSTLQTNADRERQDLLQQLTTNSACAFTADDLAQMETLALDKLARSLRPGNYAARSMARNAVQQEPSFRVLPAPSTVPQARTA